MEGLRCLAMRVLPGDAHVEDSAPPHSLLGSGLLLLFFKGLSMALSLQASILQLFLPCVTKNTLTKPGTE